MKGWAVYLLHRRMCLAGTPDDYYSLLTDNEHNLNAQFVRRGQRLNEDTGEWFDLPSLEDRATWLGAVGLTFEDDSALVSRTATGEIIGKRPSTAFHAVDSLDKPGQCTSATIDACEGLCAMQCSYIKSAPLVDGYVSCVPL